MPLGQAIYGLHPPEYRGVLIAAFNLEGVGYSIDGRPLSLEARLARLRDSYDPQMSRSAMYRILEQAYWILAYEISNWDRVQPQRAALQLDDEN